MVNDGLEGYARRCLFDSISGIRNKKNGSPMSIGLIRFLDMNHRRTKKGVARGDCFRRAVRELFSPAQEPEYRIEHQYISSISHQAHSATLGTWDSICLASMARHRAKSGAKVTMRIEETNPRWSTGKVAKV